MRFFLLISMLFSLALETQANENRPAYLEIKQTDEDTYNMVWKVPARGPEMRLNIHVQLPVGTEISQPTITEYVSNAFIDRSVFKKTGGLAGERIQISGLASVTSDVLVRIERLNGSIVIERLTPAAPSFIVSKVTDSIQVAKTYLLFGIEHILQGWDHLLFVACLAWIAGSWRRILVTITGFTIAHSVTLTLAALELMRLPLPPIEAAIALSIVFLAREIVLERRDTLTWRYPIAVSASFGLLHGFGFASALKDIGLPPTEIPAALFSFNVGVEIGQIIFVLGVVAFLSIWERMSKMTSSSPRWIARSERLLGYPVGSLAMLWTVERVANFS